MALLQQAANSSLPVAKTATAPPATSSATAAAAPNSSTSPPVASTLSLVVSAAHPSELAASARQLGHNEATTLPAYPPLSPTLSASSSRPSSPFTSPRTAYDVLDPLAPSSTNRQRATSSASAFSALSVGSAGSESGAGGMEMGRVGSSTKEGSPRPPPRGGSQTPELQKLKTNLQKPPRKDSDSLMAFSPTPEDSPSSFPSSTPSAAPATSPRQPQVPPPRRSTIAIPSRQSSTSSASTVPPRLPPRRNNTSAEPPSPTASTFSIASNASSQGPTLPPRPRPSASPAATPPRPTPSPTASLTPSSRPSPSYARHSPKARQQEGFESISLSSAGGAELAKTLSLGTTTAPAPVNSHPLAPSPSPTASLSSLNGPPQPRTTLKQRPIDPRARKRYEALFERCLRKAEAGAGGTPWPAWVKAGGGGGEQRLEGAVVRGVWMRSRLERELLRGIWCVQLGDGGAPKLTLGLCFCRGACDSKGLGSVDKDEFCKGLWLIDEELRRCMKDRG